MSVEVGIGGPDDSAKIQKRFFIDLITLEEFRVIAKISKKPVEFPERSFSAVQPPGEGKCFKELVPESQNRSSKKGFWGCHR